MKKCHLKRKIVFQLPIFRKYAKTSVGSKDLPRHATWSLQVSGGLQGGELWGFSKGFDGFPGQVFLRAGNHGGVVFERKYTQNTVIYSVFLFVFLGGGVRKEKACEAKIVERGEFFSKCSMKSGSNHYDMISPLLRCHWYHLKIGKKSPSGDPLRYPSLDTQVAASGVSCGQVMNVKRVCKVGDSVRDIQEGRSLKFKKRLKP